MGNVGTFRQRWEYLVGSKAEFTLESRVYHAVSLLSLLAIAYNVPFNLAVELYVSAAISVVLLLIQSGLYYLSRFKKNTHGSMLTAIPLINVLLVVNFFYNSGIDGPTLLLVGLIFFLTISIVPPKQYIGWVVLNAFMAFIMLATQYLDPLRVGYTYSSRISQFADIGSAYVVMAVLVYTCTSFIRRNYESERQIAQSRAAEMERLNKEKSKLFSIISHDLRMPLATVQHYLELLTEVELQAGEKQRFENELLQITRNTQEMLSNLLYWSKTQMHGQQVNLVDVEIIGLLKQVVTVQQASASRKQIQLICDVEAVEPALSVLADTDMLELIIRNLISNAIKFTSPHKTINVRLSRDKQDCIVAIQDEGSGIPSARQQEIFSLKAVSTYGTENEKGMGLGLVLCKEFITAQNGKIWFESTEGKGTTFYVAIPLA